MLLLYYLYKSLLNSVLCSKSVQCMKKKCEEFIGRFVHVLVIQNLLPFYG